MIKKQIPYRNKSLMAFVHDHLKGTTCCICREAKWNQLHHYGSDGAMSRKPSDHLIVRLCIDCHAKYPYKKLSLFKQNLDIVLITFLDDSLEIAKEYIKYLEGKKDGK